MTIHPQKACREGQGQQEATPAALQQPPTTYLAPASGLCHKSLTYLQCTRKQFTKTAGKRGGRRPEQAAGPDGRRQPGGNSRLDSKPPTRDPDTERHESQYGLHVLRTRDPQVAASRHSRLNRGESLIHRLGEGRRLRNLVYGDTYSVKMD